MYFSAAFKTIFLIFPLLTLSLFNSYAQKALVKRCDSCVFVQSGMNTIFVCKKIQDPAKCTTGVMVRIHNTGTKPVSKYILVDRDDDNKFLLFDGLKPDEYTPYQCMPTMNVPFDNDLQVIIQNSEVEYSDITSRGGSWENVLKSGKITLELSVDYDDSATIDVKSLKRTFLLYPLPETIVDQK